MKSLSLATVTDLAASQVAPKAFGLGLFCTVPVGSLCKGRPGRVEANAAGQLPGSCLPWLVFLLVAVEGYLPRGISTWDVKIPNKRSIY